MVSAALTADGICAELLRYAVDGRFVPAWDHRILREYRDVLKRPKFGSPPDIQRMVLRSLPRSGFFPGKRGPFGLPDVDDEPFLAVALATTDRVIVTGNPCHYPLHILTLYQAKAISTKDAVELLRSIKG